MLPLLLAAALLFPEQSVKDAFASRDGALVIIDTATGETSRYNGGETAQPLPPCSTFKIWNTAIGLETGLLTSADQAFWKWDGEKRFLDAWNQDLTLKEAFAASCVPAYQQLARQIGVARMDEWLKKIGYGDEDTSAGIDVFWLPAPGRKTIFISPDQQAALIVKLVQGELPFSKQTLTVLEEVMLARTTDRGTLYGKTGTGNIGPGDLYLGWFVGYVRSGRKTYAFAATLEAPKITGRDAKAIVEKLLEEQKLL